MLSSPGDRIPVIEECPYTNTCLSLREQGGCLSAIKSDSGHNAFFTYTARDGAGVSIKEKPKVCAPGDNYCD
ncbi:MAG: hypothetical protein KKB31_02340 [Nanoarchaeota archaeon]|nr:hypothetical protein [Nanoarchaeota archaeon]